MIQSVRIRQTVFNQMLMVYPSVDILFTLSYSSAITATRPRLVYQRTENCGQRGRKAVVIRQKPEGSPIHTDAMLTLVFRPGLFFSCD